MGFSGQAQAAISYVQSNSATPQTPQTTVAVVYTLAQTAGNLNVVVVGWNDSTATVVSVNDTRGNTYSRALAPTVQSGTASLVIYYAKNIAAAAAGANSVTVTFASPARFADIIVAEYSGLDPVNPLDVAVGAQGNNATSSSGTVTTTNANDLLVGANLVQTMTTGPGSGYTNRVITTPDGDILEDRVVTVVGSYRATAPVSPSGPWVMQMVAFRAAGGGGGTATTITATAGTPQSATIGTAFAAQLQATIKDSLGNPVSGVTVTFVAPGSGPSGTFAGGANTATTNAQGVATAAIFTANSVAGGPYNVTATAAGVAIPANFSLTNLAGPASTITANAGTTPQSAAISTAFANAMAVTVKDAGSNPVSGVNVTFTAPGSGASGIFSNSTATITVATNALGVASAPFTANATAGGPYTVTAAATGLTTVNFSLTNTVAAASTITANAGTTPQSAAINTAFANALAVTVKDPGNNPVSGVNVTFTAPGSGASGIFSNSTAAITVATNALGVASAPFTANATAGGPYTVTAAATGLTTVNFSLTNTAGTASTMTGNAGTTPQSATISTAFANALAVTVKDAGSNPVSGVNVTFTAPGSGASGIFSNSTAAITVATNASGVASAPFTANATVGGPYTVTAAATGLTTVNFSLTNLTGAAVVAFVQSNSATPQSPQTTVAVLYTLAQTAGNLNVVVVGWNNSTATVSSVKDSKGNPYAVAAPAIVQSGTAAQAIYYAKNIASAAAGTNTVTVTFNVAAAFPDIRIAEYSGLDPLNPLDVSIAAQGTSATSSSGSVTTTSPNDLLVAANLVQTITTGPGAGFTRRLITSPDGDILEDRIVTATASYSATAPIAPSGQWIMQMVAFRAAGGSSGAIPTAPSNLTATAASTTQINLTWTASTETGGTISQYLIERCQGTGCSTFAQIGTSTTTAFPNSGLSANTSYTYRVRAMDSLGTLSAYSNLATATTNLSLSISPRVTDLTFTRTQQFTASASATWSVDGVVGGSPSTGTISTSGLYTPPSSVSTHIVTAQAQSQSANATVYVTNYPGTFMRDVDVFRTGQNLNETLLTPANVNSTQFGKLLSYPIDGVSDASPLYVANVSIPGQGFHNVVYVATEHDSVYAFDAEGLSPNPLWKVSFINPPNITTITPNDTGDCCPPDMPTEAGITGTPVIDPTSGTLYVVAVTKEATNFVQRLHALDITTGAEKFGGPVIIQASVSGTGDGSSGGQLPFNALHENQRAALLLTNGIVYIAWGGHADKPPYHGWVMGYSASTLQQVMVYNLTPDGSGGGVWQSGDGLTVDSTGRIYFVTGNGDFDVDTGGTSYGDSILALSPNGTVSDYFTPHDQASMTSGDIDLGSGGVLLLPDQTGAHPHLAVSSGKNGTIYVVDRDNLGKFNSKNDSQIVQALVNTFPGGTFGTGNFKAPVYFNGHLYFSADADNIKAFSITNGLLSTSPTSFTSLVPAYPGATLQISANGNTNGILWAVQRIGTDETGSGTVAPGVLRAYDATNLATELYNSNQATGGRDALDFAAKWAAPLIANGKVIVATNGRLTIFGLLP